LIFDYYQRNEYNFIYRNGCTKEASKKIKDGKNKKLKCKGNNGSEREAVHQRHHREEKSTMGWPRQVDARGENTKINYGMDTTGRKEKRMSKKYVDGRNASSHDNKKFRTISMEKQRGMAFGLWKRATAVKKNRLFLEKYVKKIQVTLKLDNNKGYFTLRPIYIFIISRSFLLRI
jgi:hypothetical protein